MGTSTLEIMEEVGAGVWAVAEITHIMVSFSILE